VSNNIGLRSAIYAVLTIVALVYLVPTFSPELPAWWKFLPKEKVKLGLDLQGGMQLVMEVDSAKALESELENLAENIKEDLRKDKIKYSDIKLNSTNGIDLTLLSDQDVTLFENLKNSLYSEYDLERGEKTENSQIVHLNMKQTAIQSMIKASTEQAVETIRNRVDQFGVTEPEITTQQNNRILIQLPGIKEPDKAIKLIGKTALLEFKLVDEANSVEEALRGNIPAGDEVLYESKADSKTGSTSRTAFLLKKRTSLTGRYITDATVSMDQQNNAYQVNLSFDKKGAALFSTITGDNVGKRLAIILDDNIISAPNINEKIPSGKARITGSFTPDEANLLKIALKSGALPAPVKMLEQRTVGPSLGKDSISKGIKSMIIGGGLVVLFMVVYYGFSGVIANLALVLNTLFIMSGLAFFGATLTLPGLAGIILLIGMAVDTNVLIFERMREELRIGKTLRMAMETGYAKTTVTIIDTHVTTILSGLVLFQFGTGPVKGFAVTLTIGLLANFLTAVFITRVIFYYLIIERKWKKISI
jgi:preprotein translocase subunit SecD